METFYITLIRTLTALCVRGFKLRVPHTETVYTSNSQMWFWFCLQSSSKYTAMKQVEKYM